ncbi:MAG: hypothetical protein ACLTDX_07430 [[Clostridium] innocuum]
MLISWLQDYSAPDAIPEKGWNGIQSLPLEVGLKTVNDKVILTHYSELKKSTTRIVLCCTRASNKTIEEGGANLLGDVSGRIYDRRRNSTLGTAKELGSIYVPVTDMRNQVRSRCNEDTKKTILDGASFRKLALWPMWSIGKLLPSPCRYAKSQLRIFGR